MTELPAGCVTQQEMLSTVGRSARGPCLRTAPVGSNEVVDNIWIIIDIGIWFRFFWCLLNLKDPGDMLVRWVVELDRVRLLWTSGQGIST